MCKSPKWTHDREMAQCGLDYRLQSWEFRALASGSNRWEVRKPKRRWPEMPHQGQICTAYAVFVGRSLGEQVRPVQGKKCVWREGTVCTCVHACRWGWCPCRSKWPFGKGLLCVLLAPKLHLAFSQPFPKWVEIELKEKGMYGPTWLLFCQCCLECNPCRRSLKEVPCR